MGWIITQLNILKLVPSVQTLAINGKLTSEDIDLLASFPTENQEDSAHFLQYRREQIKIRKTKGSKQKRKTTREVEKMALYAMKHGCKVAACALYWAIGKLSNEVFIKDMTNATRKNVPHRGGTCLPPEDGDN